MSLRDEINAAIGAHGLWKTRLRQAIETGRSEFSVEIVRRDDQCAFGRWLLGHTIPARQKASHHHKECRELHQRFHLTAALVLEQALAGNRAAAEQAMGLKSEFAAASAALTRAMTQWMEAVP